MAALDGIFLARPESPGAGIPLAVKDLLDTAGAEADRLGNLAAG